MFGKLAANQGFNKFMGIAKSFMGWGALKGAGRRLHMGAGATIQGLSEGNKVMRDAGLATMGRGAKAVGGWAMGGGGKFGNVGAARFGRGAARTGGTALGVGGATDFLNPWGLGWGD